MNALKLAAICGAAGMAIAALAGPAAADGYEQYSAPPRPPVDEGRKFTYSFNIGVTSDYVFRGITQSDNDPTMQGGLDLGYGIIYAGAWASGVDFGGTGVPGDGLDAQTEIDWYGGIKPTWNVPHFNTTSLSTSAVIYYTYPAATDFLAELDYFEFKAGYSWSALHPSLVTGRRCTTRRIYFGNRPRVDYRDLGRLDAPAVPRLHARHQRRLGWQKGDSNDGYTVNVIGTDDEYYYWNAGLALTVEKLTFDFRYWDTNIGGDAGDLLRGANSLRRALRVLRQGRAALRIRVRRTTLIERRCAPRVAFFICIISRSALNDCHLSDTGVSHASYIRTRAFKAFGRRPFAGFQRWPRQPKRESTPVALIWRVP